MTIVSLRRCNYLLLLLRDVSSVIAVVVGIAVIAVVGVTVIAVVVGIAVIAVVGVTVIAAVVHCCRLSLLSLFIAVDCYFRCCHCCRS